MRRHLERLPSLKHLGYLVALHRYESFSEAAAVCGVSQPTLSAAVLGLEELVGEKLVERSNRRMCFTTSGRELVALAEEIILLTNDWMQRPNTGVEGGVSSLHLGIVSGLMPDFTQKLHAILRQALPGANLYLKEAPFESLCSDLKRGSLDAVFSHAPTSAPDGLRVSKVARDTFFVVAPATIKETDTPQLRLQSLGWLALLGDAGLDKWISQQLETKNGRRLPLPYFASASVESLLRMVADGLGYAILTEMQLQASQVKPSQLSIWPLEGVSSCELCWLERKITPSHIRTDSLVKWAQEAVQAVRKHSLSSQSSCRQITAISVTEGLQNQGRKAREKSSTKEGEAEAIPQKWKEK